MFAVQIKVKNKWSNWAVRNTKKECQKAVERNERILSNCEYRIFKQEE